MNSSFLQTAAQILVVHVLNALPEGMLIALFAWVVLRLAPRQNSGTRFAVWFLALLSVVVLPVLGWFWTPDGLTSLSSTISSATRSAIRIPGNWVLLIFIVWAIGTLLATVRLGFGLCRLRQLRRSCTPLEPENLNPELRQVVDTIAASDRVMIATSESVRVPAAIGFWKRTIVLPAWALQEMPTDDLKVILLHEFAHLQRGDDWTNLVQKIVRCIFFFHPAVWWIEKQLSVEREMACDDAVLAQTANPRGYATCLISLLEKSLAHREWAMVQAAVHRAHEASLRLAQILDKNRPVATRVWKPALGMVTAFSMICMAGSLHAPQLVTVDRGASQVELAGNATAAVPQVAAESLSYATEPFAAEKSAAVIPAALNTKRPELAKALHRSNSATQNTASRDTADRDIADQYLAHQPSIDVKASAPRPRAVATSAREQASPESQTLLFIQATQYGGAHSPVWTVQVWQVTLVYAAPAKFARTPVANSI